ncbi:MAG: phenylalanine--tRNA ligase subunit alpha [Flavobacteriales bacterium]|jgi:phenylalanyl-tRNA synthetase alpha chain|uniref:phenylalanine--tRNA ligase subunit alpha n=1 Tax=Blattabacterium sp. (Mastotermes darwiniensis) TaxID=39768 RepID=UPI000231DF8E|nr:phenylalanine--tRNA ligase subunit alpha [Blattabacterium sp. (Mastotermes darwiniensis)]AER40422.1 phenylalanyl-tRNA synthetase alpha subunit [Blattabacterium sp. (Mastotermes darwiniensis) str. MADAR]MDR1804855.1 phenylalanine--tRNA ligase subunit alpha [Flavobacteriales bacterium]
MDKKMDKIKEEIKFFQAQTSEDLERFRIKFLGKKKGILTMLFKELKKEPIHKRKIFGKIINDLKKKVQEKIQRNHSRYFMKNENILNFDPTMPGISIEIGSLHPISIIKNRIIEIFRKIGFSYVEGPEIEDDWHNFTALNIPIDHPSRDMQDTFFLYKNPDILLRTHTSSVQIRYMKENSPPFRVLSIGKVYRNETISSRSHFMFHQAEGFSIDKKVSFSDLKQTIQYLIKSLFGKIKIRFRPSYFPFTEPSAEVDVYYCDHNNNTGWLEIMGCGMIDPKVLNNVNIDSETYSGFAFGIGIERLAILIYKIHDIRIYFDNDIRFLRQFKSDF